jgi:biopolymer transport protein ExbD
LVLWWLADLKKQNNMARRSAPEVNAGSMADIAFLLLIFFLVTTTLEKDNGIARQLPPIDKSEIEPPKIKKKNLFIVLVNKNDQLLVNENPMQLKDLRESAIEFLDNGGALSNSPEYCNYCKGKHSESSSDNPDKAVISVQSDRLTSYKMYISVQNELVAAYNFLRDRESKRLYGWNFSEVKKDIDAGTYLGDITDARAKLKEVQLLFPLKLSEAEPKKN